MATNFEIQQWVHDHGGHNYFLTRSGLPYPKPVNYRKKSGEVRPAFAKYALMVALDGERIDALNEATAKMTPFLACTDFRSCPYRHEVEAAIDKLAKKATVDEVLTVLASTQGRYLDEASMEVGWCYERGWVRIDPPPIRDL